MKIKEFFENCEHYYHVWGFVFRGSYQLDALEIYTREDLDNFINDYGDEKLKTGQFENGTGMQKSLSF